MGSGTLVLLTDQVVAERAAKPCLLAPDVHADLMPVLALCDRVVNRDGAETQVGWFLMVKGIGELRAGRFESACQWLSRARGKMDGVNDLTADLFIAIASHHLGDSRKARTTLASATQAIDNTLDKTPAADGRAVESWLACQIIRWEAETLILGKPSTPTTQ